MAERIIRLVGHAAPGARLRAILLRDLLDVLIEGTRRALRLRIEGRSTAPGTPPAWLDEAAAFEVIGLNQANAEVILDVPNLGDAFPSMFHQGDLFRVSGQHRAFDVLIASIENAARGPAESNLLDGGLLETLTGFDRIFQKGVESIAFRGGSPCVLRAEHLARIRQLASNTPKTKRPQLTEDKARLWARLAHPLVADGDASDAPRKRRRSRTGLSSMFGHARNATSDEDAG